MTMGESTEGRSWDDGGSGFELHLFQPGATFSAMHTDRDRRDSMVLWWYRVRNRYQEAFFVMHHCFAYSTDP